MTMPHMAKNLRVVPYILWSLLSSTSPFSTVSSPFPFLSNLVRSPLFLNHRLVIFLILPRHLFPPYAPDYKQISLSGSSFFLRFYVRRWYWNNPLAFIWAWERPLEAAFLV